MEVTEETVNQLKITLTEDAVTTLRVDFYHRNRKGNFRYHVLSRIIFVFTLCKGKTW